MLSRIWKTFLAVTRLNLSAVCEMSQGLGVHDYHDYMDSEDGEPIHFHTMQCKRCGKEFHI